MARRLTKGLLCESCGYDLTGSPVDGVCPECGLAVAASAPERREGSPIQRRLGVRAFAQTLAAVLATSRLATRRVRLGDGRRGRRPDPAAELAAAGVWSDIRFEWQRSIAFGAACIVLAGLAAWAGLSMSAFGREFFRPMLAVGVATETLLILGGLTFLEWVGVQVIGRKNGWRITPEVAAAVCGHAAAGWLTSGVLFAVGWNAGHGFHMRSWLPPLAGLPYGLRTPPAVLAVVGAFIGLVHYETLVWIGLQRCRFGNGMGTRGEIENTVGGANVVDETDGSA